MESPKRPARRGRLIRIFGWITFILGCLAASATHLALQEKQQAQEQNELQQARQRTALHRSTRRLLDRSEGRDCRSALEKQLNGGEPFENSMDEDGYQAVVFKQQETGVEYRLVFAGQRLIAYRALGSPRPRQRQALPNLLLIERSRQYAAALGGPAWLIVLAGFLLLPRRRVFLGQVLLAVAIVCTIAWVLRPPNRWPWLLPDWLIWAAQGRYIMSNALWFRTLCSGPPSWVGFALVALSGVLTWLAFASRRFSYPNCSQCGYNLTANVSGVCPECGGLITGQNDADGDSLWWVLRGAFHGASVLSLIVCLATLILWPRSQARWDWVDFRIGGQSARFFSTGGVQELRVLDAYGPGFGFGTTPVTPPSPETGKTESSWSFSRTTRGPAAFVIRAPHWFVALVSAVLPACWLGWRVRRRRVRKPDGASGPPTDLGAGS